MRSLTVFWLHAPNVRDAKTMPVVEFGLSDAFRDFCHDTFNVREPLEYPPLKLVTVPSSAALSEALFVNGDPRLGLTEAGSDCCLFLIDDTLMQDRIGSLPLRHWFRTFLPAIPKVVLTRPGHPEVPLPQRRWTKKRAFVFEHPAKYHDRIVHLFKSFWMPRFWSVLKQYVKVKAGTNWHTPGHNGGPLRSLRS